MQGKQLKKQKLDMLQAFSHTNEVACRMMAAAEEYFKKKNGISQEEKLKGDNTLYYSNLYDGHKNYDLLNMNETQIKIQLLTQMEFSKNSINNFNLFNQKKIFEKSFSELDPEFELKKKDLIYWSQNLGNEDDKKLFEEIYNILLGNCIKSFRGEISALVEYNKSQNKNHKERSAKDFMLNAPVACQVASNLDEEVESNFLKNNSFVPQSRRMQNIKSNPINKNKENQETMEKILNYRENEMNKICIHNRKIYAKDCKACMSLIDQISNKMYFS